jgi:quercetin dioxygenase-like cupin family protein
LDVKQTLGFRRVVRVGLWVAFVLAASGAWIGHAQQPAQPPVTPADRTAQFTGQPPTSMDSADLHVGRLRFEPGAHSAWHSHERGQLLFVEQGRARMQIRGQPMREMGVGEVFYAPPNVEHWHGAAPDQPFVQVTIGWTGGSKWLEKTTDDEYAGRRK